MVHKIYNVMVRNADNSDIGSSSFTATCIRNLVQGVISKLSQNCRYLPILDLAGKAKASGSVRQWGWSRASGIFFCERATLIFLWGSWSEQKNGSLKNFQTRGIINATVTESDNKICDSIGLESKPIDSGSCEPPSKKLKMLEMHAASGATILKWWRGSWGKRHSSWGNTYLSPIRLVRNCHRSGRNTVMCTRMSAF